MSNKRYWTEQAELRNDPEVATRHAKEFLEDPFAEESSTWQLKGTRRDFLKAMGFGLTAATLAACQKTPVRYALPYVDKPADVVPSIANYYASTFWDGLQYNSILVKTREGRPIHIQSNPNATATGTGLTARAAAHVLSLYDEKRLKAAKSNREGLKSSLGEIETFIKARLNENATIRVLTPTVISPTMKRVFAEWAAAYPNTEVVQYDSVSASALLEAHERAFGTFTLPKFHFDQAKVILGINCDFLGTWVAPVEHDYIKNRKVTNGRREMSRHIQLESNYSLTGANADLRVPIKPSHEGQLVLKLYNYIVNGGGDGMELPGNSLKKIAEELKAANGNALVVSGSNDVHIQVLVQQINAALGAYGTTIDLTTSCNLRQGRDADMARLVKEMKQGKVDALFVYNCNPAYTYHDPEAFKSALKNVQTKVGFVVKENETTPLLDAVLPVNHPLESWGDAEPFAGHFSIQQPTITPLFKTKQFEEYLLNWLGNTTDYYKYLQANWMENILPLGGSASKKAWRKAQHDGVFTVPKGKAAPVNSPVAAAAAGTLGAAAAGTPSPKLDVAGSVSQVKNRYGRKDNTYDLVLYQKVAIGDGNLADIPWLQEMPDPITKATWDNYLLVPAGNPTVKEEGWKTGDVVTVKSGKLSIKLPIIIQPGLHPQTFAAALGYGRDSAEAIRGQAHTTLREDDVIGENLFPFAAPNADGNVLGFTRVQVENTGETYELAFTQRQGTVMNENRKENVLKERTLVEFQKNPNEIREERSAMFAHLRSADLYPDQIKKQGEAIHWAMAIDLNACTGCGACVVSCQSENNVPVVGKEEVLTGREMHWIRIDRYYSSPPETMQDLKAAEFPEDFPQVVFQPMLCQHCDAAPCENVCPVLATVHSDEGLNQMAYNRCVGTRYCANNCPYKVRRFNWFDYTNKEVWQYTAMDDLGRMVLNPDVTVRARGVMEKCSFCVQRLQEGKLNAKKEGRPLQDSDITTACANACPTGAIVFGDVNDPKSEVHKLITGEGHMFYVIEEVKTYPSIGYLAKIRNEKQGDAAFAGKFS